mmetsp:Transcript_31425/g.45983  ORF Transcript_31425/g.45983 Transcript_31425/m.45983 type:complete len:127 (+) Transcript_31425:305-685(+)
MRVPGTHSTIKQAVVSMADDDADRTLVACNGDHRWTGALETSRTMNASLHVHGEGMTRLLGRWHFYSAPEIDITSRGSFAHVTCAYATDDYEKVQDRPHVLCAIMGGPWRFDQCALRSAGADVLAC